MKFHEWKIPLLLFVITLITTTMTGTLYAGASLRDWYRGFWFSIPLIFILLTHEMGHYLAAKKHGINVSPPWFIPLPPSIGIGTLGAVIRIREPITSRNALMEIGAAGPLSGMVVAIILLIIGIFLSPVVYHPLNSGVGLISEGNSIIYIIIKLLIHSTFLPYKGADVLLHPIAFAGWIGLLITMINLIPVGQLDGGHVAFAWFGDKYKKFSRKLHFTLPLFGFGIFIWAFTDDLINSRLKQSVVNLMNPDNYRTVSVWDSFFTGLSACLPWFIWPLILFVLIKISGGVSHPPVGKDKLTTRSKRIAVLTFIMFLLIFMPIPMRAQ